MKLRHLLALCLSLHPLLAAATDKTGYFRYPSVRGDTIVFTAEGDLWSAPLAGGHAQRLTTHPAEESYSAISPDGKSVAFSAAYAGPVEVYVMPLAGGLPKRLSFEGSRALVTGWTTQGEVMYTAQNQRGPNAQRVITVVNPATLQRRVLPLTEANEASMDDSGKTLFFTRFGLQITNDNVKRYQGGAVAQLWRYPLDKNEEAVKLSKGHPGSDQQPMWWQGRLYFISDRDGARNLYSMDANGANVQQHTRHSQWDVRNAALGDGVIVYQLGADLHAYRIAQNTDQAIAIDMASDYDQAREHLLMKPLDYLTNISFAANGERVAITARGRVVTAGLGALRRVEITLPEGSRARNAELSPDGKSVYAICDASGENEIWRFPADGGTSGVMLTKSGHGHRVGFTVSPDGKSLAHFNKQGELWLLDIASGSNNKIDTSAETAEYASIIWSPDSKLLALARADTARQLPQLMLYDVAGRQLHKLSSDKYESSDPAFSPDGHWLYFLSNRHFQAVNRAPWGDRNLGPFFDRRTKLYAIALQADKPGQPGQRFPFQAANELDSQTTTPAPAGDAADARNIAHKPAHADAAAMPAIDWKNIAQRLYEAPLAPGNYRNLQTDGKRLYFLDSDSAMPDKPSLTTFAIDNKGGQPEVFAAGVQDFALSANGKKLYFRKTSQQGPGEMLIVDAAAKAPMDLSKAGVRLADWALQLNPRAEWRNIFNDAWRLHRDYLFDRNMRGVDWLAMRKKYAPLAERANDRADLNDVLGMMTGELGVLHSQIVPGQLRKADDGSAPGFLGGVFERQSDGYLISHIYRTEAELPSGSAPLAQPGVDARAGDIIVAVNGKPANSAADLSELLRNQAGQQVLLTLKRGEPFRAKSNEHNVIVTAVNDKAQASLRYSDWEQTRREQVERVGQSRIGYLHLRAMVADDIATFAREFYANYDRDGLIIDVRRNNGGNIDSWIIEKLLRRAWSLWVPRDGRPGTNMQQTFRGHLVVLTDELTYSDGESFAAGIQALGLGPIIGKRTAGAGVWLSDGNVLSDKGRARAAELAVYGLPDGKWLVEGVGVVPDIEVENPPHASFNDADLQLDTALSVLADKLKAHPIPPLKAGTSRQVNPQQ
jgi:tricorn protease